ncbi:MAG: formylmethanofuran dehydrogenase subunit C [Candidatus Bathyarchaeota archaeon]|jgi:formylmethanofuran dehydrogenase subunit C
MKELRLTPNKLPKIPLEAEVISPNKVAGKTLEEVRTLPVYVGNDQQNLGDFFEITGEIAIAPLDQLIVVEGEVGSVKYIGAGMTEGRILVEGCSGMHTGAQMEGGELIVTGDAGDWAGAEMRGGVIRIHGTSGNQTGAAYRGSAEGMIGGCIVTGGSVGSETGTFMSRGMIVIQENAKPFLGTHMNGGEIFVFGKAARRLGAMAKGNGGFIACFGEVEAMLPTYVLDTAYRPTFMKLYLLQLKNRLGIEVADRFLDTPFSRYRGDISVGGNAEILIAEKQG